jgi:hypothetical protein
MSDNHNQDLARLVEETIRSLCDKGIAAADLAPLVKLHEAVKAPSAPSAAPAAPVVSAIPAAPATFAGQPARSEPSGPYDRDGRRGEVKASEELMARVSAIIDVLVQSGQSPDQSAQMITRQLLALDIQLPEGGDMRAWKRLMDWRNNLVHHKRAGPAWDIYCAFKEELTFIPPDKRLRVAVGELLWDQAISEYFSANIA